MGGEARAADRPRPRDGQGLHRAQSEDGRPRGLDRKRIRQQQPGGLAARLAQIPESRYLQSRERLSSTRRAHRAAYPRDVWGIIMCKLRVRIAIKLGVLTLFLASGCVLPEDC